MTLALCSYRLFYHTSFFLFLLGLDLARNLPTKIYGEVKQQNQWRIQASKLSTKVAGHFERLAKMDCETFNKRYDRTIDKDEEQIQIRWQEMKHADCKYNGRRFQIQGANGCCQFLRSNHAVNECIHRRQLDGENLDS